MPQQTINLEFLNHNSQRSYPLADHATKRDRADSFSLPDSFILELYFPVHAGLDVAPERFFLRSVAVFASGYNVTVGYDNGTETPDIVAAVNIAKSAHVEKAAYALPGIGDYADSVGKIVIGRIDELDLAGAGQYVFDYEGGVLDPDAIRPIIRGVSSIVLQNGNDRSDRLYGDIELVAGANIRLTPIVVVGKDPQIRIDAISGEGLTEPCACEGTDTAPPIRTINGIPPTAGGNFTILGDSCLLIEPITNGLQLNDDCSSPCCGCEELEAITRDLERFGVAARTLENLQSRIDTQVEQMSIVVLGSRLGDNSCLDC